VPKPTEKYVLLMLYSILKYQMFVAVASYCNLIRFMFVIIPEQNGAPPMPPEGPCT
jgi:hypothetical protein